MNFCSTSIYTLISVISFTAALPESTEYGITRGLRGLSDCSDYSDRCPMIYDPVCANDGNTYGNLCLFAVAKCENESLTMKECVFDCSDFSDRCPMIDDPVCADDGNTYGNLCFFAVAKCENKSLATKECD